LILLADDNAVPVGSISIYVQGQKGRMKARSGSKIPSVEWGKNVKKVVQADFLNAY
jgi:hypothetical protein